MAEIKSAFNQGKMNKDLDERVIPKGQYREALNIQISTSEGSDVGVVQNILGNSELNEIDGNGVVGGSWECVGAIADEKNDALYWLIHNSGGRDAILEYKDGDIDYVLTAMEKSGATDENPNRSILGFTGDMITGINIISGDDEANEDKLLLFTDNTNEPRKININRCKQGTTALNLPTRLIVNGEDIETEETAFWAQNFSDTSGGTTILYLSNIGTSQNPTVKIGDQLIAIETTGGSVFNPSNRFVTAINYTTGEVTINSSIYNGAGTAAVGNFVRFKSFEVLKEEHITVIKKNPTTPPSIKLEANTRTGNVNGVTNATEGGTQFVTLQNGVTIQKREGDLVDLYITQTAEQIYVGMGLDGEVPSGNQPLKISETNWRVGDILLVQLKDPDPANTGPLQFNYQSRLKVLSKDNPREIGNTGEYEQYFETEIVEVKSLMTPNPVPPLTDPNTGEDIINLFDVTLEEKEAGIFQTKIPRFAYRYKYEDNEYSAFSPFSEPAFLPSGFYFHPTKSPFNAGMVNYARSITVQDFIPADIPKDVVQVDLLYKEEGQTTIYSVDSFRPDDPIESGQTFNPWNSIGSTPINYYTPGITVSKGSYEITSDNVRAAVPENQLLRAYDNVPRKALAQEITGNRVVYGNYLQNYNLPSKPIVKAGYRVRRISSSDYISKEVGQKSLKSFRDYQVGVVYGDKYGRETPVFTEDDAAFNVPFDRCDDVNQIYASLYGPQPEWAEYYKIYVKQVSGEYYNLIMDRVYRAEDEDNLWISFPSSDRNKITEDSFISLKKQIDLNTPVTDENKFKVIDIKNEAPDFIKIKSVAIATLTPTNLEISGFVGDVPVSNATQIAFATGIWNSNFASLFDAGNRKLFEEKLYFVFFDLTNEQPGSLDSNVRVSKKYKVSSYSDNNSNLTFVLDEPIDQEVDNWIASGSEYNDNVSVKLFKETKEDDQEFEGRFFVKITQNQITDKFLEGQIERKVNERVSGSTDIYYLADEFGTYSSTNTPNFQNTHSSFDSGNLSGIYVNAAWKSDTQGEWITNFKFGTGQVQGKWFIDQAYFRSTQSNFSLDPKDSKDEGPNYFRGIFTASASYTNGGANAFQDQPYFYKNGRTYMCLSFGAVGQDLHPGWTGSNKDNGDLEWASLKRVQNQFVSSFNQTKHDNQWKTGSSVEKKLVTGTKFKFRKRTGELDTVTYEIKNVLIRRSYCHTPWSYVQAAIDDYQNGSMWFGLGYSPSEGETALQRMGNFGKRTNRRVTFICEIEALDGNPNNPSSGNGFNPIEWDDTSTTAATQKDAAGIEFTTVFVDEEDKSISVNPAVWETEPADLPDLNLYYEASQAYPLELHEIDSTKSNLYAPVGCKVWCSNPQYNRTSPERNLNPNAPHYVGLPVIEKWIDPQVISWNGNEVEIYPGLDVDTEEDVTLAGQANAYVGKTIRFFRPDNSFTSVRITGVTALQMNTTGMMSTHKVRKLTVAMKKTVGLAWSNCYSFQNGVESNRVRDDFNRATITNGVRVSSTIEEPYAEERRGSGLIFSGLYNSTNGINNLNQFIQAENITKDLSPRFGTIQKLFQRTTSLIAFCEDRVVGIIAGKDTLFSADGDPRLVASSKVLGDANPFVGEYGISKDPASFAKESYRAYFTDRQRGAVLRLSMDGITPISDAGMRDYFRDNLKPAFKLVGSYDDRKNEYNLTIDNGVQTYPDSVTVSYKEDVKGWVSFKSFIPDYGVSMANNYYTFYEGKLFKHHDETKPRNRFYGVQSNSYIQTVFNDFPSIMKGFRTLNYEGDAGWTAVVNTDKQSGTVSEFIEKEGKYFNYIQGQEDVVDISAFNFQGIGTVKTVQ